MPIGEDETIDALRAGQLRKLLRCGEQHHLQMDARRLISKSQTCRLVSSSLNSYFVRNWRGRRLRSNCVNLSIRRESQKPFSQSDGLPLFERLEDISDDCLISDPGTPSIGLLGT